MNFSPVDLSVLAYANHFTLWHYVTSDDDITVPGYFNAASDIIRRNDLIIANIDTDGTVGGPLTQFYVVTDVSDDSVSVALNS